ncbi:MAG: glycosyltransferase family 4 protein [Proteobacteria bacterium]|nr:glycosyltransferase family 4 protein [Pseudomonadota bacterium]MDA0952923.1 glycosyltransferase family 4 protein [Pseudomonadota bacterium]
MTSQQQHVPAGARERLGKGPAEIQLMSKGDFDHRLDEMAAGRAPRDFFYGFLGLVEKGYDARFQRTDRPYTGLGGAITTWRERLRARLTGFSERDRVLEERAANWFRAKVMVSFTDHFSLTMGRVTKPMMVKPYTIGLFHGLSDIESRLPWLGRMTGYGHIWRSLAGLDHIGFFGPADREQAIARYGLDRERTSIFPFGVDTDFWCPGEEAPAEKPFVLSVGSDPSRDFATLVAAPVRAPVHIITRLPVVVPADRPNVTVMAGHYFKSPLDDVGLRRLYRQASVVVVTLKDVFQPTGYSVCLQAMACGRPVVLSDIRGLWAPGLYVDGQHARLVPPADPQAMAAAINQLLDNPEMARRIGENARAVTLLNHRLETMDAALENLVCLAPGITRR